jgi:rRNA maturation protein Nop10
MDAHPAKYSPDDKYATYRLADRYTKLEELKDSATPTQLDKESSL